jgi:hypothetical protein
VREFDRLDWSKRQGSSASASSIHRHRISRRVVPEGVGGEFVQGHTDGHGKLGRQNVLGAGEGQSAALVVGVELAAQQSLERGGLSHVLGDEADEPSQAP